jgi:hypothetical protein
MEWDFEGATVGTRAMAKRKYSIEAKGRGQFRAKVFCHGGLCDLRIEATGRQKSYSMSQSFGTATTNKQGENLLGEQGRFASSCDTSHNKSEISSDTNFDFDLKPGRNLTIFFPKNENQIQKRLLGVEPKAICLNRFSHAANR